MDERRNCEEDLAKRYSNFEHWIETNRLIDLGFSGLKFTWNRGYNLETRECARLDSALCDRHWASSSKCHNPSFIAKSVRPLSFRYSS